MKQIQKLLTHILLTVLIIGTAFGCAKNNEDVQESEVATENSGILEIYVLNTGKADAIILTTDNHIVLIDTGEETHGQMITDFLTNRDIYAIDYMIITHFDRDHVGGAAFIIDNMQVHNVVVPNYLRESRHYLNFVRAMDEVDITPTVLERMNVMAFAIDGVSFVIYPANLPFTEYIIGVDDDDEDDDEDETDLPNVNNFSLITHVIHGENYLLFTGDAKAGRLRDFLMVGEMQADGVDFLKVPHHGSFNRRSEEFIQVTSPRYAVITAADESHVDSELINTLDEVGATVFFTSYGHVYARSDGENLLVWYIYDDIID
jgi:beta-lactamase superfamily II metal-dependent hydrolase